MNKKFLIYGSLIFVVALSFWLVFSTDRVVLADNDNEDENNEEMTAEATSTVNSTVDDEDEDEVDVDEDEVDDVSKVDAEKLPSSTGKFELKGIVTAVDVPNLTLSVNGLMLHVMTDAKIRGGSINVLAQVAVHDRVEVSGNIIDGNLNADKVRVKGPKSELENRGKNAGLSSEAIEKLRAEIMKKIDEILAKIKALQGGTGQNAQ
ncbi:MAG: hypothetical protein HY456_01420 [Parcubacteria group bacterium]|nr:hypothetical protein [Parcubacteria group bacterium]